MKVAVVPAIFAAFSALAQANASAACESLARYEIGEDTAAPKLAGIWDFEAAVGDTASRGEIALGPVRDQYAGAITPAQTNTLAITNFTVSGDAVDMTVWSPEGDVKFRGRLAEAGKTMCGIIAYHDGREYEMIARQRPNAYRDGGAQNSN